jgi:phosphoglycerate dehydrogenase-like enzyme
MSRQTKPFRVAFTGDFFGPDGATKYPDVGLSIFDGRGEVEWAKLAEHRPVLGADQVAAAGAQGVVVLTPAVTAETVSQARDLLAIGRFGVGYDAVDLAACTQADVVVFITAGAVDRSVAEATIGWMIALCHNLRVKDGLVRTGRWDERSKYMGRELRERTLGAVGFGGIGRAVAFLLRGFGMKPPLVYDPFLDPRVAEEVGVRLVGLDELLAEADFVSIHCPLNDATRGLIGVREIGLMKPDAYLINTARGGIVDEDALYDALESGRIAGAALDCFGNEPLAAPPPFAELDNVILAPHCIAWTDELFRDIGRAACGALLELSLGRRPRGVVNPAVLDRPGFQEKWARLRPASP